MLAEHTPIEIPERLNLADYLLDARIREGRGGRTALLCGDRRFTYDEVQALANRAGHALADRGVEVEHRVLVVLPDGPEFVAAIFGIWKLGAVLCMGNPLAPAEDLAYLLDYTRARALVTTPEVAAKVATPKTCRAVLTSPGTLDDAMAAASDRLDTYDTHRDDFAVWLFTSGSTGKSKGACHFHHDIAWNTERYAKQVLAMREDDVTMSVPKLFFGYATGSNLWFPFAAGATAALYPERSTAANVLANVRRFRPTVLTNVPTTINELCALPDATRADLASLRLTISAGEALPPELYRRWNERFGVEILDGIGSAEMFHIYVSNRIGDVREGSLGRAVPGYEARVIGADGREVPDGEVGTLHVSGDSAAVFYWQAHDKSKQVLRGDTVVSGDLFSRDADGRFWYAGRADDMLKVGGIWVAPVEVENCLLSHPVVRDAAVVGHTDGAGLVVPKAFVSLKGGAVAGDALARELQEFVKSRLARHKYPRLVEFVDELPRNDRGKVDRKRLRS